MKKSLLLKLIANRKLRLEDGSIQIGEEHFNILPTIFVSSLTDYYYKEEELFKLYLISWFWGFEMALKIKRELGLEDPEEIYSVGMDFMENEGLGLYRTDDYELGKYTYFKIKTNPYLKHLNAEKFSRPVDYFMAGAMGGGGVHVHESLTQCLELRCKANGSSECAFLTATKEEYQEKGLWSDVEKRYDLNKIEGFQRDVCDNYEPERSGEFIERLSKMLQDL